MAASNNNPTTFSIGVDIDSAGRIKAFAQGSVDARLAEDVAGKLVKLAHAVRDEARDAILNEGE